jgi:TRAP-type mannitol/chloroaromatic compound transport system substrate-binding protein
VLRRQLDAYDQALEKKMSTAFVKEITESQRQFAERAVKWEQDVVVSRKMAYDHYFGKKAPAKKA